MITDPLFYLLATVAVILLGLSKGGFFGLGVMALPLMSLEVPPLQAAAIILPTVLAQDALTVWTYRRDWSAWNLKIMIPSMAAGIAVAGLFAASLSAAHIRLAIGLIAGTLGARSAIVLMVPALAITLSTAFYVSLWFSFVDCFGSPDEAEVAPATADAAS